MAQRRKKEAGAEKKRQGAEKCMPKKASALLLPPTQPSESVMDQDKSIVFRLLTQKTTSEKIAWGVVLANIIMCSIAVYAPIKQFAEYKDNGIFFTHDLPRISSLALNILTIFLASLFAAISLSFWPKTRNRVGLRGNNSYNDPSFLILGVVITIWNAMLTLKIMGFIHDELSWGKIAVTLGDIANSSFFLLAALQFDFAQSIYKGKEDYSKTKDMVKVIRIWLSEKNRLSKLTLGALILYGVTLLIRHYTETELFKHLRITQIPATTFSILVIVILFFFLNQLYKERKFNKIRYAVWGILGLALVLSIRSVFVITDPIQDFFEAESLAFYKLSLIPFFFLLGFSLSNAKVDILRLTLLSTEIQRAHFAKSQLNGIIKEINQCIEASPVLNQNLSNLRRRVVSLEELNKLIYSYKKGGNVSNGNEKEQNFSKQTAYLISRLRTIFQYRDEITGNYISRINTENIDENFLSKITDQRDQENGFYMPKVAQMDLMRLITELVLNAQKHAYDNDDSRPGEIFITATDGEISALDKLIIRVKDTGENITQDEVERLNKELLKEITPELLEKDSGSLGLKVVKAIVQLNAWDVKAIMNGRKGLCVQIYIPLQKNK